MGLFVKNKCCVICSGKVSSLLPWIIEGHYICNDCHGIVDMQAGRDDKLTLTEFKEYLSFREENQLLRNIFTISCRIDFGQWDLKPVFDYQNHLFCMSHKLDKTIFTGASIEYFSIREDDRLLFEGSESCVTRYKSEVTENAYSTKHSVDQNRSIAVVKEFHLSIKLNHPYWTELECSMKAPDFSSVIKDRYTYLQEYNHCLQKLDILAHAIKIIAFPEAGECDSNIRKFVLYRCNNELDEMNKLMYSQSVIEEIKRYKTLLDDGIITDEEFITKKKQLMEI